MQIYRFTPKGKFTRIYLLAEEGADPRDLDQDAVWVQIKREALALEEGDEKWRWDSPAEEDEARREWLESWHDKTCWTPMGAVAVDNHY